MEHFRLQLGCIIALGYIMIVYYRDIWRLRLKRRATTFDLLLFVALVNLILDGVTSYIVNFPDLLPKMVNLALHGAYFISIDTLIFNLFLYMISATGGLPKSFAKRATLCIPYYINVIALIWFLPTLQYHEGCTSNYVTGVSSYGCFVIAGVYILMSVGLVLTRWNSIQRHKRFNILTGLAVLVVVSTYQIINPESLVAGIGALMMVLGAYMNQEDPAILELDRYHNEMVTGFSTLIENRDESTGGHVKRTTRYVELLADGLNKRGLYQKVLTKDYLKKLLMAAPMHDIGKIAVPDSILQKPGKLTSEEFALMQQHSAKGAEIITQSFGRMRDEQYLKIARDIALHHHEKWNGNGYPDGLSHEEIPLSARIMAIADVFDAVSENRCYRAAMPIDKCFEIIAEGSGKDFDPVLVEVFLDLREEVEEIYNKNK